MSKLSVFSPFTLPNGQTMKNRFVKAAMEEGMAELYFTPGRKLHNLYSTWAKGGAGLLITGNIMIDRNAMTGPGGVALEKDTDLNPFTQLVESVQKHDCKIWAQINHPGRQVYRSMGGKVYSPSDIALDMGKHSDMFGQPTAMSKAQIEEVISRFTDTAIQAEKAGFNGVQIHAAHGYLIAQFLSPLVNNRSDEWGGALENRAKLLTEVVKQIQLNTSKDFAVAVKLNSADFQRGGFSFAEANQVIDMLKQLNVDLVELSGGSYEAPAMQGVTADGSTLAREAYFLEFAKQIAENTDLPIMTTGGIYRLPIAEQVIASGVDFVGIATALAYEPNLISTWRVNERHEAKLPKVNWRNKTLRGMVIMMLVRRNLNRIGVGKLPTVKLSPTFTLIADLIKMKSKVKEYKRKITEMGENVNA